jgi:hypothetical protein
MECVNATSLHRKPGQMGHPAFVAPLAAPRRFGSGVRPAINGQIRPGDIRRLRTGDKRH